MRMVVILGSILFSVGCSADKGNRTTLVNPVKEVTAEEMTDLTGISLKVHNALIRLSLNPIFSLRYLIIGISFSTYGK